MPHLGLLVSVHVVLLPGRPIAPETVLVGLHVVGGHAGGALGVVFHRHLGRRRRWSLLILLVLSTDPLRLSFERTG